MISGIAQGTYDAKSTPLSETYPGVETHATAIDNMLDGASSVPLPRSLLINLPVFIRDYHFVWGCLPAHCVHQASLSGDSPTAAVNFRHMPVSKFQHSLVSPGRIVAGIAAATPASFAYTYFIQDRQSRFMLEALSKVVSPTVARELAGDPIKLRRNTKPRELTVLFSDLANFTSLSESMSRDNRKLVEILDDYLSAMSDEVIRHNGTLDKYIGDSVMCFWNAPVEQTRHAVLACRAALAMQALKKEYVVPANRDGGKEMHVYTRIGINTAEANYGFVGSSHLMNYTAMGDGVNLASRLEGANKLYGTRILIAEETAKRVQDEFLLRRVDSLVVKGKTRPISVYELISDLATADPKAIQQSRLYESGLDAYQNREWALAESTFLDLSKQFGDHQSIRTMLKRVAACRVSEPPPDWTGAYGAEEK